MEFESPTSARSRWEWPGFLFLHLMQSVRSDQALKDHLPKEPHSTQTEVQSREAPSQGKLKAGWQQSAGLLTPFPPQPPRSGASSSFSPPLHPHLADLETEAKLEDKWTNRSWTQASREHQQRIGKHGSLGPGPCPGHSSAQTKACREAGPESRPAWPEKQLCEAQDGAWRWDCKGK